MSNQKGPHMRVSSVLTMDEELSFQNCIIQEPPKNIKELFPDESFVEIIEDGKSYILNTNYIIMIIR